MLQLVGDDNNATTFNISIKEMYQIIKAVKPPRFNVNNRFDTFNDPRVTDFAYVSLKLIWELVSVFKKTGIKIVDISVDYEQRIVIFTSPGYKFKYRLLINNADIPITF